VSTKQNEKKNNKKRREGSERVLNYMVDCIVKIKKDSEGDAGYQ